MVDLSLIEFALLAQMGVTNDLENREQRKENSLGKKFQSFINFRQCLSEDFGIIESGPLSLLALPFNTKHSDTKDNLRSIIVVGCSYSSIPVVGC